MKPMTQEDLSGAFAGESQAHLKYTVFAEVAEREKLPNVARLFRAAAYAEQIHASNHFRALQGVGKTVDNLQAAWEGETFEINEMYPAYIAVAGLEGEKRAQGSMEDALVAEKVHQALYAAAKQAVSAGSDAAAAPIWVCSACGFTGEGDAPEKCPVCGAVRTKLVIF